MTSSMFLRKLTIFNGRWTDDWLRQVAGGILHRDRLDRPPIDKHAVEITYEHEIHLNQLPRHSVIKLAKREHVDAFFSSGKLRLGTFNYFATLENAEAGDPNEGGLIVARAGPNSTIIADLAGGFDNYVFCAFSGQGKSEEIRSRFGYDASYEIHDVPAFVAAVARSINSEKQTYGLCVYRTHKVLVSISFERVSLELISNELLGYLAGEGKNFIKPIRYAQQNEFRITWRTPEDVETPLDIECPDAVAACRRLG